MSADKRFQLSPRLEPAKNGPFACRLYDDENRGRNANGKPNQLPKVLQGGYPASEPLSEPTILVCFTVGLTLGSQPVFFRGVLQDVAHTERKDSRRIL